MILAFGIIGIVCGCFPLGIAAWIMGNADLAEMKAGRMDRLGEGLTTGGKICGIISVVLAVLWLLGIIVQVVILGATLPFAHGM